MTCALAGCAAGVVVAVSGRDEELVVLMCAAHGRLAATLGARVRAVGGRIRAKRRRGA